MAYVEKDRMKRAAQTAFESWKVIRIEKGAVPANGAIVLWLINGSIAGGASYGDTKDDCRQYVRVLDDVVDNWDDRKMFEVMNKSKQQSPGREPGR